MPLFPAPEVTSLSRRLLVLLTALFVLTVSAGATPTLVASGTLTNSTDLSGLTGTLEDGVAANALGGIGSGLAWAGGDTFVAVPDSGPNSPAWAKRLDDSTSYISRFDTLTLSLTQPSPGNFSLTPTLNATTLLYSTTGLTYAGPTADNKGYTGTPSTNTSDHYYFTGRSDNFTTSGGSLNANDGRLDTEAVRVSADGKSIFTSDEYGPYVYQFDRATGARIQTFTLPSTFGIANPSSKKSDEIANNVAGRTANAGMESLAITPDGKTLVGLMQSSLLQDGGSSGSSDRIVSIDIATGVTHQYIYNGYLADTGSTYGTHEILAINSHQFLVLERDSTGYGAGSNAGVKRLYEIDLTGATDVGTLKNSDGTPLSGDANLLPYAVSKSLFLDISLALEAKGTTADKVPAGFEGIAFGNDVVVNGVTEHTLFATNDNNFDSTNEGYTQYFAFTFTDADLGTDSQGNATLFVPQMVPEPGASALLAGGGALLLLARRRRAR